MSFGIAALTYWFAMHTRWPGGLCTWVQSSCRTAARIDVSKVTLMVFTISGALSGLADIMYASRWGFANPSNTGNGFEFRVIVAVVIGGVSVNGGIGTVLGVAAALPLLGIYSTTQSAVFGAVILIALLIDRLVRLQGQKNNVVRVATRAASKPSLRHAKQQLQGLLGKSY